MHTTNTVGTSLEENSNEIESPNDCDVTITPDQLENQRQNEDDDKLEGIDSTTKPKQATGAPLKVKKRKSWYYPFINRTSKSNEVQSAPPIKEPSSQLQRSRSFFFRVKSEPAVPPPVTTAPYSTHIRSSESDQAEVLSSTSMDKSRKLNSVVYANHLEEYDFPIPIVYGNYSGNPICNSAIKNPHSFFNQLITHQFVLNTVETSYNTWIVWECQDKREKRIVRPIDNIEQYHELMNEFVYDHIVIMRKLLVPNFNYFRNGYLLRIRVSHGKNDRKNAIQLYFQLCEDSIFRKFPRPEIKINVCGIEYHEKLPKLTEIACWIHPIWKMSFSITDQVSLLLKLMRYTGLIQQITLVDINNHSKVYIKSRFFA